MGLKSHMKGGEIALPTCVHCHVTLLGNSKTPQEAILHPTLKGQRDRGRYVEPCTPMRLEIQQLRLNQQSLLRHAAYPLAEANSNTRHACPPRACQPGAPRQAAPGGALPRALWHNSVGIASTLTCAYVTDEENARALSPVGFHHDHLHVLGWLVCAPEQTQDT